MKQKRGGTGTIPVIILGCLIWLSSSWSMITSPTRSALALPAGAAREPEHRQDASVQEPEEVDRVESQDHTPPLMSAAETTAVEAQLAQARQVAALYGAFWTLEDGLESELVVSNAVDLRLSLLVTLFTGDGRPFDLPGIVLGPHAVHHIQLRDFINQSDPTAMDRGWRSGSLRLRHSGAAATMIAAQVGITHAARRLAFDVPVEPVKEASPRLEGVFGAFDEGTRVNIVLANLTDQPLPVRYRITGEAGLMAHDEQTLAGHETVTLAATELLQAASGGSGGVGAGGVSLEYQGLPGSLRARGLIVNESLGLSSSFGFTDPATQRVSVLQGTGLILQGSQLGGLPPEAKLDAWLLVRNAGSEAVVVTPTVFLTERVPIRRVPLAAMSLQPEETKRVNLTEELMTAGALTPHLRAASLDLKYTGDPGSVVAHLYSAHAATSQVFDVPLRDMTTSKTNAWNYPWLLDEEYNTVVYISNMTREERRAEICLLFPDGGGYQLDLPPLRDGETVAIDLKELRRTAGPDVNGDEIPRRQGRGLFMWKERQPGLLGRAVVYSARGGISHNLSCASEPLETNCIRMNALPLIGGSAFSSSCLNSPSSVSGLVGESQSVSVYEVMVGCCSQAFVKTLNITTSVQVFSYNPSVVRVVGNQLQFVGAGQTTVQAVFDTTVPQCGCDLAFKVNNLIAPLSCNCVQSGSFFDSFPSPLLGVTVQACTATIEEETISPGTLPVRNPATIRRAFAPVFEVMLSPRTCPVTWSLVSGPGSIIGSRTSTLVTVNGNALGTIQLRATTAGGNFAQISVPVVNQRNVDVRVWIVRRNDGSGAATTTTRVNNDMNDSNLIWQQCGVQFNLVSISFINNTTFLTPNLEQRNQLRNTNMNTGGIEIYYVESFPDNPTVTGATTNDGVVITRSGNTRTAAHELGHAMGLGHRGIPHVSLMWEFFSNTIADITLGECNSLSRFTSN